MTEYQDFILCYRKPHGINWDCECGYKSVSEVNERTSNLLSKDNHLTTTFFPIGQYTPSVFTQMTIQKTLSPKITMYNKPESPNGEEADQLYLLRTLIHEIQFLNQRGL